MHGILKLDVSKNAKFSQGRSCRGETGIFLETQYARTSCCRDTYSIRIVNLWNALPINISLVTSLRSYKKLLRDFFFLSAADSF